MTERLDAKLVMFVCGLAVGSFIWMVIALIDISHSLNALSGTCP